MSSKASPPQPSPGIDPAPLDGERRDADAWLEEDEGLFRRLFEAAPDALLVTDREGRVLFVSAQTEQIFGHPPAELLGRPVEILVPERHRARHAEQRGVDMEGSGLRRMGGGRVLTGLRRDGTEVSLEIGLSNLTDHGRMVTVVSAREVTERTQLDAALRHARQRAEDELRASEARYRQLFANAGEAIYVLQAGGDRDGAILEANAAAAEMHGYTIDELLQRTQMDLDAPEVADGTPGSIRRIGQGEWVEGESTHVRKDGSRFPVEFSAGPLDVDERRLVIKFVRDITERKSAEEALRQAKKDADAASRAKSSFLANMSHEIRTPMNAILGNAQLLQRDPKLTLEQRRSLDVITRAGERLLGLINDVLEMSRIEVGYRRLRRDAVDLGRLLDDLERVFRLRAEAARLTLTVVRSPGLPRYVVTDGEKLRQVLANLLSNAVKFTERGGVVVRVTLDPSVRMVIEVEDTGNGIGMGEIDQLFHPFAQARPGVQAHGGAGLGLAISRELARLMGGDITVESRLGEGSVFRLELPIEVSRAPPTEPPAPPSGRVVSIAGAERRVRILVVGVDSDNRDWIRRLLEQVGFDVREAGGGSDAVARLHEQRPHLVIVDLGGAGDDGYGTMLAIRTHPNGRRVVIIGLGSDSFDEERDGPTEAGADSVLRKPCGERELLEEIRRHLDIEYHYAKPPSHERPSATPDPLTMRYEHVRRLPARLVEDLRRAAHAADYEGFRDMLAQIPDQHAAVAELLRALLEQYAYDQIESLLGG